MGVGACHWMSLEKSREAEGPATVTGEQDKEGLDQREPTNVSPGLRVSQLAAELTQRAGFPMGYRWQDRPKRCSVCFC